MATFAAPETGTDPVDTHGHDIADADPDYALTLRDAQADAAEDGQTSTNATFLAQTPEEVQAQIDNVPG